MIQYSHKDMKTKKILITGASSGIGRAAAISLAKEGYHLAIAGRRIGKLQLLYQEICDIKAKAPIILQMDVKEEFQVKSSIETLIRQWNQIDVLINNAGLSLGLNALHEGDLEDWDNMMNTNVRGLLMVSKEVAKNMTAHYCGQIINISSIAGTQVYANGNVYCASKHAVDALTKAMRIDFLKYGIKVSSISPGAVHTEFSSVRFKGDNERANEVYQGYQPLLAKDIAASILHIIKSPSHVNINDIEITPTAQANAYYINKTK